MQLLKFQQLKLEQQLEILEKGEYDPDTTDTDGNTMLHYLAKQSPYKIGLGSSNTVDTDVGLGLVCHHLTLIKELIRRGASVDYLNRHEQTPIELAATNLNLGCLSLLLAESDRRIAAGDLHTLTELHRESIRTCVVLRILHSDRLNAKNASSVFHRCLETGPNSLELGLHSELTACAPRLAEWNSDVAGLLNHILTSFGEKEAKEESNNRIKTNDLTMKDDTTSLPIQKSRDARDVAVLAKDTIVGEYGVGE